MALELVFSQPFGCESLPILAHRIHTIASAIVLDRSPLRIAAVLHFLGVLLWSFYDYTHLVHLVGFGLFHLLASHLSTVVWC